MVTAQAAYAPLGEVLVVDDTPANLQLLTGMLQNSGYKVRAAPSGQLGLKSAGTRVPDVLLLDINMPDMDGYEVCRRLKADPNLQSIPVLFISALSDPLDKVKAFAAGGVDYVTKPFQIEEVQARIDTHVRLARMQQELQRQNQTIEQNFERLQELEQLRDTLTHMLAHDMRTPLTGILASLQFLAEDLEGGIPKESLEDLQRGSEGVQRLVRMLNDLLDISRMESNEMPLKVTTGQPAQLVEDALSSLGAHGRSRAIHFERPQEESELNCDQDLIQRVLVNLLHNAIKFTPPDGQIQIRYAPANTQLRFEVEDDGDGIAPGAQSRIFERFGQAQLKLEGKTHSSGLGLAFCKLAVEAHRGTIGVNSAPGRGATFWFELPLSAVSRPQPSTGI